MKMANILFKLSSSEDLCLEKLGSVCRICLQTYMPLFSIFHDHIDEMISEFVPDKVDKQDNFPHQICKKCLEDVKVAYSLKKQIEYSHEIIKNLLCGKRLSRSSKKKVYDELLSPSISSQNSNNKTYFQCHICKRRLKRRDILKIHLEKIHKCFELQYNDKFDSGKEKVGNISSENESDNEPLISLLKHTTLDTASKTPVYNNDEDVFEKKKYDTLRCNDENNTCNSSKLNFEKSVLNFKFRKLRDFRIHLKRHTIQKHFKCQYCNKAFFTVRDQLAHERLHREEKNDIFAKCGKAFAAKYKLRNHVRVQTGKQFSKYKYDAEGFSEQNNLIKHPNNKSSKNCTNKTYFQCHICKRRLKEKDILKQHLEKIHKCFELNGEYNKFDSGKEKFENFSSGNESDDEPLISLLKDITSDIERKVPINDNHDLGQQYTVERIYCNLCEMYYSRTYFIRHKREVHGGFEPGGKSSLLNKTKIEEPQKQFVESNPKTNNKHYNNLQGLDGERKRRKSASYNMYAPKY